jgi:hypothetical protein
MHHLLARELESKHGLLSVLAVLLTHSHTLLAHFTHSLQRTLHLRRAQHTGNGEVGAVFGAGKTTVPSSAQVSMYISANSFWFLDAANRGDSHRAGVGGVSFTVSTSDATASGTHHANVGLHPTFSQRIESGAVEWTMSPGSGPAPPPPPGPAPSPGPPVPGCDIVGNWTNSSKQQQQQHHSLPTRFHDVTFACDLEMRDLFFNNVAWHACVRPTDQIALAQSCAAVEHEAY